MKYVITLLFVSLACATSAHAQPAAKTRAQVKQELYEAKAKGQVPFGEIEEPAGFPGPGTMSRADVAAELRDAKARGEYTFGDLDYPSSTQTQPGT
jgi:hypothetical protein